MKEVHILGISQYAVTIIFDLMKETDNTIVFKLYPNLNIEVIPEMPIHGTDYEIMPLGASPYASGMIFFGTTGPKNKESIFEYFNQKHGITKDKYGQIIHSSAYIAGSSHIEKGVVIEPQAAISSQSTIGFGTFIKRGSLIGHHNVIGAYTDINPGVTLSGKVNIGQRCIIGSGAVIKDHISIGNNTIIGIGSVVTKNIPANSVAFGNPCRVVRNND